MKHLLLVTIYLTVVTQLVSTITAPFLPLSRVTVVPQNRSYVGLVVAITSSVEPSEKLVDKLIQRISGLSEATYRSIGLSIASATILLPGTWNREAGTWRFNNQDVRNTFDKSTETADIVVGNFEKDIRTVHVLPCTYQALRIEVNKDLVLGGGVDPKDLERLLEHHWYHKRYGVFEERPVFVNSILETEKKPTSYVDSQTYYHTTVQTIRPVSCATKLEFSYNRTCDLNDVEVYGYISKDNVSLPTTDCGFKLIEPDTETPSIMSHLNSEAISGVCDDTTHNYEAPTQQNRLCDSRSVKSVLDSHPDFKDQLPVNHPDTPPPVKFSVEISRPVRTIAFVLDVSVSMLQGQRQEPAKQVITSMVMNLLEDEADVMIVTFAISASVLVNLTKLSGTRNRQKIVDALDRIKNTGFTCIGCGLEKAYDSVQNEDVAFSDGLYMILITDGRETADKSKTRDMFERSARENFFIYTVLLSPEASNQELLKVMDDTNSQYHTAYNLKQQAEGIATKAASAVQRGVQSKIHQIYSSAWIVKPGQEIPVIKFWVEENLRSQANLTFRWFNLNLGHTIRFLLSHAEGYTENITSNGTEGYRLIKLDELESNRDKPFKLVILNDRQSSSANVSVDLTSREFLAADASTSRRKRSEDNDVRINDVIMFVRGERNITLTPGLQGSNMSPISLHVILSFEGKLSAPYDVLGAVSFEPEDMDATKTKQIVPLYDNGVGADIIYGDGVYSAYFTNFENISGIYYPTALLEGETYMRYASSESFSVTIEDGYSPSFGKLFSPSRINDLMPENVSLNSTTVNFTAPGANLDQGTVESYRLYYSSDRLTLANSSFILLDYQPKPAGEYEHITLFDLHTENGTIWLAISAVDIDGMTSQLSNIISIRYIQHGDLQPMPWFIWLVLAVSLLFSIILVIFVYWRVKTKPKLESRYTNPEDSVDQERPLSSISYGMETLQRGELYLDDGIVEQNNIYQTHRVHRLVTVNKNKKEDATPTSDGSARPARTSQLSTQSDEFENDLETGEAFAFGMVKGSIPEGVEWNIDQENVERGSAGSADSNSSGTPPPVPTRLN